MSIIAPCPKFLSGKHLFVPLDETEDWDWEELKKQGLKHLTKCLACGIYNDLLERGEKIDYG